MKRHFVPALIAVSLVGCSSSPEPETTAPPPQPQETPGSISTPDRETGFTRIVAGAGDSVGAIPGSATAQFAYRFKQVDPPSDGFTFRDRDLSFYFRPTPSAFHFQVENRQNRPVWIEWERSTWMGSLGTGKVAHATTRYADRYNSQPPTQIVGLQRYSDYLFPIEYLVDPAGSDQQLHRVVLPEDQTAQQYVDRVFGVDLVFRVEDRLVPYTFRFKVASVVPR